MAFCSNCGNELPEKGVQYCTNCGNPTDSQASNQQQQSSYQPQSTINQHYRVEKRNFWKYGIFPILSLVLSIVGFGVFIYVINNIGQAGPDVGPQPLSPIIFLFPILAILGSLVSLVYFYYIYLNFDDFKKLQLTTHQNNSYPSPMDPVLPLIVLFVFAPIAFYLKYDQLYKHIKEQHQQTNDLPPNPLHYVFAGLSIFLIPISAVLLIYLGLFNFIPIVIILIPIGISIFVFRLEMDWQEKLNQHIDFHNI